MKNIAINFFLACLLTIAVNYLPAQQQYQYTFNNNLNEVSGGPALTEVTSCSAATGNFSSGQTITTTSGTCAGTPTVFSFNSGGGLVFPNNPSFITTSYTIHSFFKFTTYAGNYKRIIDFSNSASNNGIYILDKCLNFSPNGNVGACTFFTDGNYYLISLVRDGTTGTIKVYVNGTVFGTYADESNLYVPATSTTPILFFKDDNAIPCENSPGDVKYISLSSATSTDAQVTAVFTNICSLIALPVTLVSFDVTKVNSLNNLLSWKTSQELGITSYVIERSADGIHFESIGQVNALGNNSTVQDYRFVDPKPIRGTNYYRIKILDKDNSAKYGVIKNIRNTGRTELTIFPVPVNNVLKINIDAESAARGKVIITDASGRQLHNSPISVSQGINNISLNTSNLSPGAYLLKVNLDGNSIIKEFTKF